MAWIIACWRARECFLLDIKTRTTHHDPNQCHILSRTSI